MNASHPAAPGTMARDPLVLIVDDSALVRDALQLLFEETGHRVAVAASAAEAIAACVRERPDVMLLDLTLPDGDGLTVMGALRTRDALPRTVAVLTGHDDPATLARCREAGCREVLVKPVPTKELLSKVKGWIAESPGVDGASLGERR